MSGFEFFFSFYGLLLGLAMAELLSGSAGVVRAGRTRSIGWGTGLLALEVATEIVVVWLSAWHYWRGVEPSLRTMAVPFVSGAAYYTATCLVFPREPAELAALDDHFLRQKRHVATCLLIPFLLGLMGEFGSLRRAWEAGAYAYIFGYYLPFNLTVFAGYLVLIFSRSYRLSVAALVAMLGWFAFVGVWWGY